MPLFTREKANVLILVICQSLFIIAAITVMTLSGVVGYKMSPNPTYATLPIALMMIGTVISTLPASLYMAKVGRRVGFITGALFGGVGGAYLSVLGISHNAFWLFCLGNFLLGVYQGFAMYYRFAAIDVASPGFKSRALSLVMVGGVIAAYLGPWNASALINLIEKTPYAGPYLILAIQSVLAIFLLSLLRVPPSGEPEPGSYARPLKAIVKLPSVKVAMIAAAIGYAIMILVMSATPLAMKNVGFDMTVIAHVMQWHVLGMFLPSFFTGSLIKRFGTATILHTGSLLLIGSALTANTGQTLTHFEISLVLLGVGWNFLFIGGSTLLATTHTEAERGKVQGSNDLIIFTLVAIGSLMAGKLLFTLGWESLNLLMLSPVFFVIFATQLWVIGNRKKVLNNVL